MPASASITTFNGLAPPWSLASLDANFSALNAIGASANNYSNYLVDTGAANAYVVTFGAGVTVSLLAGLAVQFKATNANTGTSTLNVSSTGVKNLVHSDGTAVIAGEIPANAVVSVIYDGTSYQIQSITAASASGPNLVVNPNWLFDQINEGALYTYSATSAVGPDGWTGSATGAGVFKLRTLADPDNAALKCLEITCTTADAAIAAGDNYHIVTAVEGYDAAALSSGTAVPAQITIQFKFKSNVTGVYGVMVQNSAANRSYVSIITVADTLEHEYVVTLTMDTTGTWLYTNGVGLYMRLTLSAGSTFQGTAGAWSASNILTTSAQCNFMSVNTNIAYLKRVQIFQGSSARTYQPANYQAELAKCQRYYEKSYSQGVVPGTVTRVGEVLSGNTPNYGNVTYKVDKRAVPTWVNYNPSSGTVAEARDYTAGSNGAFSLTAAGAGTTGNGVVTGFGAAGDIYGFHFTANARLT